jgi:hypothetical protein
MEFSMGNEGLDDGVSGINGHGGMYFLLATSHPGLLDDILFQIWRIHPSIFILRRNVTR